MTQSNTAPGQVAVTYIGRRPEFLDRLYGSGLSFTTGQTRALPPLLASRFLRHADLFEPGGDVAKVKATPKQLDDDGTNAQLAKAQRESDKQAQEQASVQDLRDRVAQMDKDALKEFALVNYRQTINKSFALDKLRAQVEGFIDQFGVV